MPETATHSARLQKLVMRFLSYLILILFALIVSIPLYFLVISALQAPDEVLAYPLKWFPTVFHWENFINSFAEYPFLKYIGNSFFTSISISVLRILTSILAGYGLAKFHFKGNKLLFILILSTIMLPFEVIMVPMFLVVQSFGWLNSYQGVIIPMAADAFGIFLMRQFFLGIPDSLIEAARIDGANELTVLFNIVVPLTWPPVITLAIFSFREAWDLYIWPTLILTKDEFFTLTMGIARFNARIYVDYTEIMAIALIGIIPTTLLFFFLQRYFIQGIAVTGLKE
jgi:ABC-type glycerol-3-phosphate transport system permease component